MVLLSQEVNVSGGDDAHQLAAHGARCGDGDAGKAMPDLGLQHVAHSVRGAQHHRVCDEALLKLLWAGGEEKAERNPGVVCSLPMGEGGGPGCTTEEPEPSIVWGLVGKRGLIPVSTVREESQDLPAVNQGKQ